MRTTNRGVLHRFANGQDARSNNLRSESGVLVSYRTPIAQYHGRVILDSSASYSMTTESKHRLRHSDIPPGVVLVAVPDITGRDHAANLAYLAGRYRDESARMLRARYVWGLIGDRLEYLARAARDYADGFGLPVPAWAERGAVAAEAARVEAERAAREARLNAPEAVAKREAAAARREALASDCADHAARIRDAFNRARIRHWISDHFSGPEESARRNAARAKTRADIRAGVQEAARALRAIRRPLAERNAWAAEAADMESRVRAEFPTEESFLTAWADLSARVGFDPAPRYRAEPSRALPDRVDGATSRAIRRLEWAARYLYAATVESHRDATRRAADAARRAADAARRAAAEAEQARLLALYPDAESARAAWRATGDRGGFRVHPEAERGPDLLRISGDRVVTQRGAEVPLREARATWRFIFARVRAGELPWHPSGMAGTAAGGFALSRIAADGSAVFGCHVFTLAEMRAAAAAAGEES